MAIGSAAASGVLVTRSITRPIDRAVQVAESVADGDLSLKSKFSGSDETEKLSAALSRMSQNLHDSVSSVRHTSDSIATGSSQISAGNSDLSQRTEKQASALQQAATTMKQLGTTARKNAESAKQPGQHARGASAVAAEGGEVVAMQAINDASRTIGDILGVNDGIAFQTNILALSAAVEAARAGEQGRGFAAVASEVRGLAQRSAQAAKEIKSMVVRSVEQVEQGTVLTDQAGKTMGAIVGSIQRVSDIMVDIASASSEQSFGVEQVGEVRPSDKWIKLHSRMPRWWRRALAQQRASRTKLSSWCKRWQCLSCRNKRDQYSGASASNSQPASRAPHLLRSAGVTLR